MSAGLVIVCACFLYSRCAGLLFGVRIHDSAQSIYKYIINPITRVNINRKVFRIKIDTRFILCVRVLYIYSNVNYTVRIEQLTILSRLYVYSPYNNSMLYFGSIDKQTGESKATSGNIKHTRRAGEHVGKPKQDRQTRAGSERKIFVVHTVLYVGVS